MRAPAPARRHCRSAALKPPAEVFFGLAAAKRVRGRPCLVGMCPFCAPGRTIVAETPLCVAFEDAFPVSPGHTLIITRRHVETYFECSADEKQDLWKLVDQIRERLVTARRPHGFNVGFNCGATAGQTV